MQSLLGRSISGSTPYLQTPRGGPNSGNPHIEDRPARRWKNCAQDIPVYSVLYVHSASYPAISSRLWSTLQNDETAGDRESVRSAGHEPGRNPEFRRNGDNDDYFLPKPERRCGSDVDPVTCDQEWRTSRYGQVRTMLEEIGMRIYNVPDEEEDDEGETSDYQGIVCRAVTRDDQKPQESPDTEGTHKVDHASEPSQSSPAACHDVPDQLCYRLQIMRWGLVPSWSKERPDYGTVLKTINCRSDSLARGGMWASMRSRKRCVVVAQGFFEWLKAGPKERVPYYIRRHDGRPLLFAGLWDCVSTGGGTDGSPEQKTYSYTVITTDASKPMRFLHDRMPVIFDPNSAALRIWLDPLRTDWSDELQTLLRPWPHADGDAALEFDVVSKDVNKVGRSSPSFVVPVASSANKANIANFFHVDGKKELKPPLMKHETDADADAKAIAMTSPTCPVLGNSRFEMCALDHATSQLWRCNLVPLPAKGGGPGGAPSRNGLFPKSARARQPISGRGAMARATILVALAVNPSVTLLLMGPVPNVETQTKTALQREGRPKRQREPSRSYTEARSAPDNSQTQAPKQKLTARQNRVVTFKPRQLDEFRIEQTRLLPMSPTYTMSAHLCKQIYASWRQSHSPADASIEMKKPQRAPDAESRIAADRYYYQVSSSVLPSCQPPALHRSVSQKHSMDSDRSSDSSD
ncbi:duf159 domain containing protein [Grosmannia clavigera kw1407]|uniref:Duf159 domain containing protein n=1 Tax=Grosmannia clavigera (strain kw1407 / UAMH 11150) TaxID=655863 RepID=F0XSW4_GROCL|nr:duf159 domain containing protein [Grosmannia clavigera kw1407]EFW99154.1 duf159 domain containing protein [Grosmannia clavigera kw1407]